MSWMGLLPILAQAQSANLEVTWDPVPVLNTNNLGYRVYYAPTNGSLALKIVEVKSNLAIVTNLVPGESYLLFVTAFWYNTQLESLPSETITYKLPDSVVKIPSLPTPSELALLNLSLQAGNAYRVQLSFNSASSTNVTGYRVTVTGAKYTNVTDSTTRFVTLAGLTNDVQYAISVASFDAQGNQSVSAQIPFKHSIATNWIGNLKTRSSTVSIGPQ